MSRSGDKQPDAQSTGIGGEGYSLNVVRTADAPTAGTRNTAAESKPTGHGLYPRKEKSSTAGKCKRILRQPIVPAGSRPHSIGRTFRMKVMRL